MAEVGEKRRPTSAAVLSRSQNATLTNLAIKEKSKKVPSKNLLCQPLTKWPRPEKTVEENILLKLTEVLKSGGNIFKSKKATSEEEKKRKGKIRSQLDIGVSAVFRALEKDCLSCILVSGQASPAITVDHVISLARERGCPLLCLDQLAPAVSAATESKCVPLALGFKTMEQESQASLFKEVVSLVKDNTDVKMSPLMCKRQEVISMTTDNVKPQLKENTLRPASVDVESGKHLLEKLLRLFTQARVPSRQLSDGKKRKKKRKKKNLKDAVVKSCSQQFEIGKRSVEFVLPHNSLQLILVSDTVSMFLSAEAATSTSSLLHLAAKQSCPVLCVPGLSDTLRPVFEGSVSILAIKKLSSVPAGTVKHFESLIKTVEEVTGHQAQNISKEQPPPEQPHSTDMPRTRKADGKVAILKEKYVEKDYSYLYILKKDSQEFQERIGKRKAEMEREQKELTFASDFISLGAHQGVTTLMTKGLADGPPVRKKAKTKVRDQRQDSGTGFISLQITSTKDSVGMSSQESEACSSGNQRLIDDVTDSGNTDAKASSDVLFTLDRKGEDKNTTDRNARANDLSTGDQEIQEAGSVLFSVDRSREPRLAHSIVEGSGVQEPAHHSSGGQTSQLTISGANVEEAKTCSVAGPDKLVYSVDNSKNTLQSAKDGPSQEKTETQTETASGSERLVFAVERSGGDVRSVGGDVSLDGTTKEMVEAGHSTAESHQSVDKVDGPKFGVDRVGEKRPHTDSPDVTSANAGAASRTDLSSTSKFSLDRSGNQSLSRQKNDKPKKTSTERKADVTVMGDLESTGPDTGFNVLAMHQPRQKGKGMKRKMQSEEGFISFAYTEANIHTMVANTSRKKKKKKKK